MSPPKFGAPSPFTQRTRSANRLMEETIRVVDVDEISMTESESISSTWVEEKNLEEEVVSQALEVENPRAVANSNTSN
jgi:hypothetical protein